MQLPRKDKKRCLPKIEPKADDIARLKSGTTQAMSAQRDT